MAAFLRKVKSTINAAYVNNDSNANNTSLADEQSPAALAKPKTLTKRHRQSHVDLSAAVESEHSVRVREQHQQQQYDPFADFRRRIARKASTFSLRGRLRRGEAASHPYHPITVPEPSSLVVEPTESGSKHVQSLSPKSANTLVPKSVNCSSDSLQVSPHQLPATVEDSHTVVESGTISELENHAATQQSQQDLTQVNTDPVVAPLLIKVEEPQGTHDIFEQKGRLLSHGHHLGKFLDSEITCKKMATESAAPPVPYTRLKEIATSACEAALSDIASYNHTSTESWNTSIINHILSTLVQETTKTNTQQPQFKYVVNSTIIQHAASSSSNTDSATSGRRGMHAASGAFWNNEKDGMWSFKYEAAEAKGLDVVVGIIWVWVG